jgi:hypothetical protein
MSNLVALTGCLKTSVNINRKNELRKLTAAMAMLKPLVFLSIHGRNTATPTRRASSMSTSAIAWAFPLLWAKPTNMALMRRYPSQGMMNQ